MSDRELVTIDKEQWNQLLTSVVTLSNAIWGVKDELKPLDNAINNQSENLGKWLATINDTISAGFDKVVSNQLPDLSSKRLITVRVQIADLNLTIEGDVRKMNLTDTQQATAEFGQPVDKKGFPASIQDGSAAFSASDDSVTVTQDSGNPLKCLVVANHPSDPAGAAIVTLTADADLGDGVKPITGSFAVLVTSGEATGFGPVTEGPAEEQP
jgi:hypothetical protein